MYPKYTRCWRTALDDSVLQNNMYVHEAAFHPHWHKVSSALAIPLGMPCMLEKVSWGIFTRTFRC